MCLTAAIGTTFENKQRRKYNFVKLIKGFSIFYNVISILVTQKNILPFSYQWNFLNRKLNLSGDVELNPGPATSSAQTEPKPLLVDIDIVTYNIRGLKDKLKLKRVLNTCYNIIKNNTNTFIMLQETHLDSSEEDSLKLMWRHSYVTSPGIGRQHGVVTLFDKSWELLYKETDDVGRLCIVGVKKFDQVLGLTNLYAPNNHDINFFNRVYEGVNTIKNIHPEAKIVIGGDFNLVMQDIDAVNRGASSAELASRQYIKQSNEILELADGFRLKQDKGGYTWSRGNCMSRLDMIFIPIDFVQYKVNAEVKWGLDVSDHASVKVSFKIKNPLPRGKGLYRVNTSPLESELTLNEVQTEITHQLADIPSTWDPHKKLDFVKTVIRGVLSQFAGKDRQKYVIEQEATTYQLNYLINTKEKLLAEGQSNPDSIRNITMDIASLEGDLQHLLDSKAKYLHMRSGAKWYEEGEKSNSYFLNLIKARGEQKLIVELCDDDGSYTTQGSIMDHVTTFYTKLYDEKETHDNFDDLLSDLDLPTLNDEDRRYLDNPISLEEMERTLKECQNTAPGPDGIPYVVYKSMFRLLGPYLLDAWNYSIQKGILPEDQRTSCITLLPKEGKDLTKIENWRPITLTNCDLKLFTKLISDRVSTKLDKLIIPTQTAYIPGRVVHDNLRLFDFYKNYCKKNNVDGLLISLDAKKAFDSVSHKYLHVILKKYGFSDDFIETIKILYRDIKASVLVNGYKSTMIKILRSVKQGDALSCALFILCIDPLMRKIENNRNIKPIPVPRSRYTNINIEAKTGGFADDVGLAILNDPESIKLVFEEYKLFSNLSGIGLNVNKTEILKLNVDSSRGDFAPVEFEVEGALIRSSESIKICGVVYSNDSSKAYRANIIDKITKLEKQLVRWLPRFLSLEGKLLIVKTFGLSQIIYSLQMNEIRDTELKTIERLVFRFLWNNKWAGNPAPDRIKRNQLKKKYEDGGLKAPDIGNLDIALKGYFEYFKNEYSKICKHDAVVAGYQLGTNIITDMIRSHNGLTQEQDATAALNRASILASTDVLEYLQRKKLPMVIFRFAELSNLGVETLQELLNEARYPRSDRTRDCANDVLNFFPAAWHNIIQTTDDLNPNLILDDVYFAGGMKLVPSKGVTVKGIRELLLEKLPSYERAYKNFDKFEIPNEFFDRGPNPFILTRKALYSTRDRFYKYRILNGDIFCKSRMQRFGMVVDQHCSLCPDTVETIKHLIWDCPRSRNAWDALNDIVRPILGRDYVNYEVIILGNENPIYAIETYIVWLLKKIITIERIQAIEPELDRLF